MNEQGRQITIEDDSTFLNKVAIKLVTDATDGRQVKYTDAAPARNVFPELVRAVRNILSKNSVLDENSIHELCLQLPYENEDKVKIFDAIVSKIKEQSRFTEIRTQAEDAREV